MWINVLNNASAVLCAGGEILSDQNEVHAVNAQHKGEWTRKNWLFPVNNTKWKNQLTFTRKQVKKTSKRWQIWVLPRKLRGRMKSKWRNFCRNTQYKTKSNLNAWKKFCESLKESRAIENLPANELDLLSPNFSSPFVKKMALSMSRVPRRVCCGQTQWHKQEEGF